MSGSKLTGLQFYFTGFFDDFGHIFLACFKRLIKILKEGKIFRCVRLIAAPQGGFIAPHVWEIVCRKNVTIFKCCHYSRFYITISISFWKIETKNLNSDPRILVLLVLRTNHQLHISYLNIRNDYDIEAATCGYS